MSFFKLGEMVSYKAISILFYVGFIPLIAQSYMLGKNIYETNTYSKSIQVNQNGQIWLTGQEVNNIPLGILGGLVSFIVTMIIWKIICELLIIVFRYFEAGTNKNFQ
ncbi:DUF4282 domain-containing protein [Desulfosporosinus lacus]|uniref:Uncharacterized protein n=1 Tax=Desulfosporosinus lacus DSM 15449 TaxID=1121420 RepID=A0A1M5W2S8_9FIRM|nr:DUF4282 domain-containing protein [Desulfosporosinus lacus]SHH81757.1 protein of unknown function [Desulfosporosinus lacus DSM 15449]